MSRRTQPQPLPAARDGAAVTVTVGGLQASVSPLGSSSAGPAAATHRQSAWAESTGAQPPRGRRPWRWRGWAARTLAVAQERRRWAQARSLTELCALTSLWLDGTLSSQPGYGSVDVDEHLAPGLTQALVALNRAGVLTRNSQAGYRGPGYGGAGCTQLAAVEGYARQPIIEHLRGQLAGTPYRIRTWRPRQLGTSRQPAAVVVTRRSGLPYTQFGWAPTRRQLALELAGCSPAAVADVQAATCLTIWDPVPGRNTLWADLSAVLSSVQSAVREESPR